MREVNKTCRICGNNYKSKCHSSVYCSDACRKVGITEVNMRKRQNEKARTAAIARKSKTGDLTNKVAAATAECVSYGTIAAREQAKTITIQRKIISKKSEEKQPPKAKKVIYEYRRIQFDKTVEQWLQNEEEKNGH